MIIASSSTVNKLTKPRCGFDGRNLALQACGESRSVATDIGTGVATAEKLSIGIGTPFSLSIKSPATNPALGEFVVSVTLVIISKTPPVVEQLDVTLLMATLSACPLPVTLTSTEFALEAFDGMSKLLVKVPWLIGLKLTLKLHDADGCTACMEQLSPAMLKGAASEFN
jgi:hypothetical protein